MKNSLLLLTVLIFSLKSFSQDSKISLEVNYPIPLGDNFIGKSYDGIADIGIDYKFFNKSLFNVGASLNGGVFLNNSFDNITTTAYTIQPRVFTELKVLSKIRPSLGIGYTIIVFNISGDSNLETPSTESGLNLNLGITYDITKKIFAQVQYDFSSLSTSDDVPDISFNTQIQLLKIGVGYRL
ncbi:outer membrane protein [Aquimarina litoralis]|uniref:outer membrane protein n=1 Tax=Aquimarina litoralis TaxID=584605 RepID=UPI001C57038E|nr:outer membrane beta-barrel protein [Aquimarina litoralis]MBW1298180.1 outer membrane beta-barrel protein [Aquimarina litoralis]